jgi:hypothetical protein
MKYLALIFKNLGRSKRRTILTILSIGVSLFVFAMLISVPAIATKPSPIPPLPCGSSVSIKPE